MARAKGGWQPAERRRSARFRVRERVYLCGPAQNLCGCVTRDVGGGGLFLESRRLRVWPGDEVVLSFLVQKGQGVADVRRHQGAVVHWSPEGIGVAFVAPGRASLVAGRIPAHAGLGVCAGAGTSFTPM